MTTSSQTTTPATPIVIRFGALGDMILLTPMLRALHRRYGRPCIVIGSGGWLRPLLANHPDVADIWQLQSRRKPYLLDPMQWKLVAALRTQAHGPVYICDHYALPKIRFLLRRGRVNENRCVYTSDFEDGKSVHWVDRWLSFSRQTPKASLPTPELPLPLASDAVPFLPIDVAERADIRRWLDQRSLAGKRLVLIQPGNKRTLKRGRLGQLNDDKSWPAERWAAVIGHIATSASDLAVILCGAPAEEALLKSIQTRVDLANVHIAAQDLPLRRLLALLEIASGMISIDTGPAHAAAALGCPLIVMYGAAPPAQWLPRSPSGSDVLALGGPPQSFSVDAIRVEDVLGAWQRLRLRC